MIATDPNDTVEALLHFQGRERGWVYWIILGGLIAAIAALFFIKADITVLARGAIRPRLERMQIVAPVDGHIVELNVRENMEVRKDAVLLRLDSDAIDEQARLLEREQDENAKSADDLRYLLQLATSGETARLNQFKLPAYRADWEYYLSRLDRAKIDREKARNTMARTQELHAVGAVAERELDDARFAASAADAAALNIEKETVSRWESDLRARLTKLAELQTEQARVANDRKLREVRAPVTGTAMGFTGLSCGQYARGGARLGDISPTVKTQIEVLVPPKDVGFVWVGQPVRVQVDSFPHSKWGTLQGTVTNVSADGEVVDSQPVFKVQIVVANNRLFDGKGNMVEASKGMNVTACFVVTRLTLFEMLVQSMSDWINPNDGHRPTK